MLNEFQQGGWSSIGTTTVSSTVFSSTNYCPQGAKLAGFRLETNGGNTNDFYTNNIAFIAGICTSAVCVTGDPAPGTCLCPIGTIPSGTSCVACGAGSYAPTVGSTACTACTNGQGSAGSTSVAYTVATDTSSSTCPFVCNYGYGYNSATGLCEACDQGQYASAQAKLVIPFFVLVRVLKRFCTGEKRVQPVRRRRVRGQHSAVGVPELPAGHVLLVRRGDRVPRLHVHAACSRVGPVRAAVHEHRELHASQLPRVLHGADFVLHANFVRVAARVHELCGRDVPGDELCRGDGVPSILQQLQSGILH